VVSETLAGPPKQRGALARSTGALRSPLKIDVLFYDT
jgi:hypothetical protein